MGVYFLKKLEQESSKSIFESFDLFIGTSAGATNALLLGMNGSTIADLEKFWTVDNLKKIMNQSFIDKTSIFQTRPKYSNEGKKKILQTFFEDRKIGQSLKPVVVTAYDLEARKPILLTSYGDPEITAVNAANASSAAPIYFPTASMEDGRWLIDGGIATNNPSLLGYVEAKKIFSTDNIKVLGIGAGLNKRKISGKNSRNWGALGWFRHDILGIMLESSLQNEILKDLIGDDYLRVNSSIGNVNRRMDDMSEKNLERIRLLADDWWQKYGKKSINFINS
jgi:patatin-like phospholipase/acyl hydrolase